MSGNPDRDRAESRGDQLIECIVRKAALEASLHTAQMLLLDIVDLLDENNDISHEQMHAGINRFEEQARHYLLTSAWVLPPDTERLASLSLAGTEEVALPQGEGGGATSTGTAQAY